MTIVLTSIGKRVELIRHLKSKFRVVGVDCSELNPAKEFTDGFFTVPRFSDPEYINALLDICKKENADYLIPLHEGEFSVLAASYDRFKEAGITLLLSDSKIIDICKDKKSTADFFEKYDIPAPKTYKRNASGEYADIVFPAVVKPADGMGSANVFVVEDAEDLKYALKKVGSPIVQQKMDGTEYTMDVLCDNDGECVYIVPRIRIEVQSGEVSKSKVVLNKDIIDISKKVMESLKKEGRIIGPFTLQCFVADDGSVRMLEINPRFGGGVPLSFRAGADYASALVSMREGKKAEPGNIKELTMLRYSDSVFI